MNNIHKTHSHEIFQREIGKDIYRQAIGTGGEPVFVYTFNPRQKLSQVLESAIHMVKYYFIVILE